MAVVYIPERPVVVLGAARTPQGVLGGELERFRATELGAFAIGGALLRAGVEAERIDECIMGNVVSAGLMQAPAKQAGVGAGMGQDRLYKTVNTVCASGMTAVMDACLSLSSGISKIAVAGGMESCSRAPYYLGPFDEEGGRLPGKLRGSEFRLRFPGRKATVEEHVKFARMLRSAGVREASVVDSLTCPFEAGRLMMDYAAEYAEAQGLTIDEINRAAGKSYRLARAARDGGAFAREIVAAGDVEEDGIIGEEREADLRAMSYDYVTAYNAPRLGDGAAALVLTLEETARVEGLKPVGRLTAISRVDTEPGGFVHAPMEAVRALKEAAGDGATIIEANESFGMQIPIFEREFPGIEINPYGGAVALTHPVGASGARVVVTLLNAMKSKGHERGVAAICFGSGGAMAAAVELCG